MDSKNEKQSRREFIVATARKVVLGGLGALGISLGYKTLTSDGQECEVNLPCRNCFKLGSCLEEKAVTQRREIKQTGDKKGASNG